MEKTVLVVWADGMEEIEAVTPVDLLRRAGVKVIVAGVTSLAMVGSRGIGLQADICLRDAPMDVDALILPGGKAGSDNLAASQDLRSRIKYQNNAGKFIAAICAAPALVLSPTGILDGRQATCYPGFEEHFTAEVRFVAERVVKDGHIITSRGPGTAFDFALALIRELVGETVEKEIGRGTLHY